METVELSFIWMQTWLCIDGKHSFILLKGTLWISALDKLKLLIQLPTYFSDCLQTCITEAVTLCVTAQAKTCFTPLHFGSAYNYSDVLCVIRKWFFSPCLKPTVKTALLKFHAQVFFKESSQYVSAINTTTFFQAVWT